MPTDTIAEALGVTPMLKEEPTALVPQVTDLVEVEPELDSETKTKLDADFEYARVAIKGAIEAAQEALKEIKAVADQSEHPRAYEVLSGLAKTVVDSSERLMELHKKNKDINPAAVASTPANVTNNNLILSTTDVLRMLRGERT